MCRVKSLCGNILLKHVQWNKQQVEDSWSLPSNNTEDVICSQGVSGSNASLGFILLGAEQESQILWKSTYQIIKCQIAFRV